MSRKPRASPRMLSNVLQAVADLKDGNGSTGKKILAQVQTAINISNVKPKPRSIATQVKKALKHALDMGILKMKAGKYKLALGQGEVSTGKAKAKQKDRSHKKKKTDLEDQSKSGRRCKKPDRRKRQRLMRRRKPCRRRSRSDSPTSNTRCSTFYHSPPSSYASIIPYEEHTKRRSRRTKRLNEKKVKIARPKRRRSRRRKRTVKRRSTPIPKLSDVSVDGLDNDTGILDVGKEDPVFGNDDGPQDFPQDTYVNPSEIDPECDNPHCLCNLKQEPSDDGHYDDTNFSQFT